VNTYKLSPSLKKSRCWLRKWRCCCGCCPLSRNWSTRGKVARTFTTLLEGDCARESIVSFGKTL